MSQGNIKSGTFLKSRPFRALRLGTVLGAGLLTLSSIGLLQVTPAGASTISAVGAATSGPVSGSLLVADNGTSTVYDVPPGGSNILTVGNSVNNPYAVAVDAAGDVYVDNIFSNSIEEFTTFGTDEQIGSGLSEPTSVAVDNAGNVYVADLGNARVVEIPANGAPETTIATGFSPWGVAVDSAGDVFVSDQTHNQILEIPAGGGTPVTVVSNITDPYGIALDASNNLYVALNDLGEVVEVPAGTNTQHVLASNVAAIGVSVDTSGNVYVPDANTGVVEEYPVGGGTATVVASGLSFPMDVAAYPPVGAALPLVATVNASQVYGGSFTYDVSYSGFTGGDTASVVSGTLSCQTEFSSEGVSSFVGTAPLISCGGLETPSKYDLVYHLGQDTVTPAPLQITPATTTMTYGTVPTITASYSGLVAFDTPASLLTPPVCTTTAVATANVGSTFPTSCGGAVDPNYTITYAPSSLAVVPAALTITAASPSMTYGGTLPSITPLYSGFQNGDTAASLTRAPTCTTTGLATSPAGSYPTKCVKAASSNYTISTVPGSLTIAPAPLSIAASSASMTYGGPLPNITPTYSGFVNGDTVASLTHAPVCSTVATVLSVIGNYASACTGAADSNYSISYTPGSVVVGPHVLTVSASSPTMTYGGAAPTVLPKYSGFADGDSAASLTTAPVCTTSATSSSRVGSYSASCSGAVDPNYTMTYVGGSVTVAAAPLTVMASSATMAYGTSVPGITPTYSGFVNGDTSASLSTAPVCTTTATANSGTGNYPSTCSGAADSNYSITYVAGSVTVDVATLTVTASSASANYGSTPPAIIPGYSGFVGHDSVASLTKQATCTASANSKSAVGAYATNCSGVVDPNYTIVYTPGALTVNAVLLTVTASSTTIPQGGSTPTITPSYSGFVAGDTAASLTTAPVCTTVAGPSSAKGSYPSTCSGALDPNYTMKYVAGTVRVGVGTLTVTANNLSTLFGQPLPRLTTTISGFPAGITLANAGLTGQPLCTTTALAGSPGGNYPITCTVGSLAAASYNFTFAPGVLNVTYSSPCIVGSVNDSYSVAAGHSVCFGPTAVINGPVNVAPTGALDVEGATIHGPVTVNGATALRICGVKLSGPLSVGGSSGTVVIGDDTSTCGGSTVAGPVTTFANGAGVLLEKATVNGPLSEGGNGGGVTMSGSSITGPVSVLANTGGVTVTSNTIKGPLKVLANSGTETVSANKVSGPTTVS